MLNLSRCIRHRGPDWSGCVVATHGDKILEKIPERRTPKDAEAAATAGKVARSAGQAGGESSLEEDEGDEAERGSILCHERLAIVGVGA